MSPNRAGLDQAIEELKGKVPSTEQRAKAADALLMPRRSAFRLRALVVGVGVCALTGALLLSPSKKTSSLAWGDVLQSSQSAVMWHAVSHNSSDNTSDESWRNGDDFANVYCDKNGKVIFETRWDDRFMYTYLTHMNYREELPNQYPYATLSEIKPGLLQKFPPPKNTIDELLSRKKTTLISQQAVQINGKTLERYEVNSWGKEHIGVDVDPTTKRIVEIRQQGDVTTYDYPASIDPAAFSWKSRVTKDAWVMDRRGEKWPPVFKMSPPILSKGPIKLRWVSLQPGGYLSVGWSGPMLNKHGFGRFKVLGVKTGKPWGPMASYDGVWKPDGPESKRIISVQVPLLEKIGDHISVRIPTATSNVLFKDMPVGVPFKKLSDKS